MAADSKGSKFFGLGIAVVAIVGIVLVVAILYRPGGFTVVAEGQGNSIKFDFSESRVQAGTLLNKLLSEDDPTGRSIISGILKAHGYYYVPSKDLVAFLRGIKETDDTREFIQDIRQMLYDLAGPFSRPATFLKASDDRVLLALEDVYANRPSSPLVATLWEWSLDIKGMFSPREVNVDVYVDDSLKDATAAACAGSLLLDRTVMVRLKKMIGVYVGERRPCTPTSAEDMLAGRTATLWVSVAQMSELAGTPLPAVIEAKLVPLPKRLTSIVPGQ